MDILHATLGPGGSRLERVCNLGRLRMLPEQGATITPAFEPPDGPHQVDTPSASQALSSSPDALSPDDPTRLTAALDSYAKQGDPADRAQLRGIFSRAVGTLRARVASNPEFTANTTVRWLLSHIQVSGERNDEAAKKIARAAIVHVKESLQSAKTAIVTDKGRRP